jgi:hypothetical protein
MADYTYYCEVTHQPLSRPAFAPGIYRMVAGDQHIWYTTLNHLITVSERVWKQGPRGGVKIIKSPWNQLWPAGYITNNEKYMQEFSWIKLQAKELA